MSHNHFARPSIKEVRKALKPLKSIPRPFGDNEGDTINGDTVLPYLTPEQQEKVRNAEEIVYDYTRNPVGEVNHRSITTLNKNGYDASLNPGQYDPDRLIGGIGGIGEWNLDISDPSNGQND
jgi:hypothetical protein